MSPYIVLFNKNIPLYGVFCVIGIAIAIVIALLFAKKRGFEFFDFLLVSIITLISAFIGAKLLFVIVSWQAVIEMFQTYSFIKAFEAVFRGGFVFYGGLIGGFIGLLITTKIKKQNFFDFASIYVTALLIGHSLGRVGCFFSGCCYGIEYDGIFSFVYKEALDTETPIGLKLLPIQLIEAFALFVLFFIFLLVNIKTMKKNKLLVLLYSLAYPMIRFILEFFRGDKERGILLNLSTSQWISIIIVFVTIIYIVYNIYKSRHKSFCNFKLT